ncbi:hypothetical protein M0805_001939 [Coniferiporia weirii]|nr:hypothetical protein M0805_001939 [Coniferiporia weirii]
MPPARCPQPILFPEKRAFLEKGGNVYVAYNANYVPYLPDKGSEDGPDTNNMPMTMWASNKYPFTGWIPVNPMFEGPILGRLKSTSTLFPVEKEGDRFVLANALRSHLPSNLDVWSLEWQAPILPSSFGYGEKHTTVSRARSIAKRSRNAFLYLIAETTGLIMLHRMYAMQNGWHEDLWARQLQESGKVHAVWLQDIMLSQIADYRTRRTGIIVSLESRKFLEKVRSFIRMGMPVWFCWNVEDTQHLHNHEWYQIVRPSDSELLLKADVGVKPLGVMSSETLTVVPFANTGQNVGETLQAFFERREVSNAVRLEYETPEAKKARLDREKQAQEKLPPGKKGAIVFEWKEVLPDQYVRCLCPREVKDAWKMYSKTQMRFDAFRNEWDLCEAFDPSVKIHNLSSDSDSDISDDQASAENLQTKAHYLQMKDPESFKAMDPRVFIEDIRQQSALEVQFKGLTFDDIYTVATVRFGLIHQFNSKADVKEDAPLSWFTTNQLLHFNTQLNGDAQSEIIKRDITRLVQDIRDCRGEIGDVSSVLFDLAPQNEAHLLHKCNPYFRIEVLHHRRYFRSESTRKMVQEDIKVYALRPTTTHTLSWVLTVTDPVAALECMRTCHDRIWKVCQYFVERGVPVKTVVCTPPARGQSPGTERRIKDLGWRHDNSRLDSSDYASYEKRVADFVQTNPRVRAAIMKGGIVWRVVVEAIGLEAAIEVVMAGPSSEAADKVYETLDISKSRQCWWDDTLTDDDEELLCGIYKIYTGNGLQVEQASWWPKSCVWEHSSMNCGYWSTFCEVWFQNRLRKIRSDQESVKNQGKWRTWLALAKKSRPVIEYNRCFSESFIDNLENHP